jgi:hypothetical protein
LGDNSGFSSWEYSYWTALSLDCVSKDAYMIKELKRDNVPFQRKEGMVVYCLVKGR